MRLCRAQNQSYKKSDRTFLSKFGVINKMKTFGSNRNVCLLAREWKTKVDLIDDVVEDTVEFTAINTFFFNKTLSNGLTGDEIVTVIDPLLTVSKKGVVKHPICPN